MSPSTLRLPLVVALAALGVAATGARSAPPPDETFTVFTDATLYWDEHVPDVQDPDGYVVRHKGQTVERTIALPPAPAQPSDGRRIIATIDVRPVLSATDGARRPNDPWTRLGNVSVLAPAGDGGAIETELVRFVTGYGGASRFEQDVTAFAPLLAGTRTLRAYVATYSDDPGWTVSFALRYKAEGLGQRRPALARPLFAAPHVTASSPALAVTIDVPSGLAPPRLRILSTGHATDGRAGNEFESCPHVLRIDGREVARWRPWSEDGGTLRRSSPWSGRWLVDGCEIRASDLDRAGWNPGRAVEPLVIPVPELTAGRHRIELEILGIRPRDPPVPPKGMEHHGYWAVSVTLLADEPWPDQ